MLTLDALAPVSEADPKELGIWRFRRSLPPADEARHRLDVDRMNREEESGSPCGRRGHVELREEAGEEDRDERVERHVSQVKSERFAVVDPPLHGE